MEPARLAHVAPITGLLSRGRWFESGRAHHLADEANGPGGIAPRVDQDRRPD